MNCPPDAIAPATGDLMLSPEGLGPLAYGATIDSANASGLVTWDPDACPAELYGEDYGQFTVDTSRYPLEAQNPIELGDSFGVFLASADPQTEKVNWIEVYHPAIATSEGIRVGDPPSRLTEVYGSELRGAHPTGDGAEAYVKWVYRGPVDIDFEVFTGSTDSGATPQIWRISVVEAGGAKDPHYKTGNVPGCGSG